MTLVVADSSPIRYLVIIGHVDALPLIYNQVILPGAVVAELTHPSAPASVIDWASRLPEWVEVKEPESPPSADLQEWLDQGEVAAITLAKEINADLVLLDEREGRRAAKELGLHVAGTLGILEAAHRQGILELRSALEKLAATNFRLDPILAKEALARAERSRGK